MDEQEKRPVSFWTALGSVFRAAFGVQKRSAMERDLKKVNAPVFIVAALVFLLAFIGTVALVVKVVLSQAGV